jgi:hypothetical protein
VGSLFPKVYRFVEEVIRLGHLDHGIEETALAVFALKLALFPRDGNSRISTAKISIADHAREIEGDFCPVNRPGFAKGLFKKAFILGSHFVCSLKHRSPALTGSPSHQYPKII